MWKGARYKYWAWLIVAITMLLVSKLSHAWDSSSAYNTIAMSYTANTTITQIINLNSTQKSANTINFKVDVKNGGGRPTHDLAGNPLQYSTQTDSATITIYRYNSSGTLLGTTVSQTYILKNYGSNAGWSSAPGDNQHPFTQASITYTGSLADTAYIKIEMKGTDGAWWAGNYGAQWRTPTVTVGSGTTNIVYNSEFGVAPDGLKAQGWTTSSGSWSNCGVTSGSLTCVTQESGVTANMWGGGYDANGGTTSGTAGGYAGTLTSDNATQAASGAIMPGGGSTTAGPAPSPRPTWPVINRPANQIGFGSGRTGGWTVLAQDYGGSNSGIWSSINYVGIAHNTAQFWATSYMRWPGADNGVSRTIWFRTGYDDAHQLRVNGQLVTSGDCCYYAYGSYTAKPGEIVKLDFYSGNAGGNDWVMQVAWDPQGDGTYELLDSNTVALQGPTEGGGSYWYSSDITTDQTNIVTSARSRVNAVSGNQIWIEEKIGSISNTVTIEQTGTNNMIQGLGGGDAILDGNSNNITVKQGGGGNSGKNLTELGVYGNSNTVAIYQARNTDTGLADGAESGGHYAGLGINGDSNSVTIRQGNQGAANSGHVGLIYIKGDSNNISLKQAHDGDKKAFISVDGSNNSSTILQGGLGNQYLDLMLTGNGHTANITQTGTGSHRATINLQNAGGASILNLTQQGTTGQQYSIMQQCANLSGCSVTVTQGTP